MKTFKKSFGFAALAVSISLVEARADMGTVWVNVVTSNSVTLDWSDPRDGHALASEIPVYRVSWAPVEAEEDQFSTILRVGSSSKPYRIPGLEAAKYYKFRVETHAAVLDVSGRAVNPKYRQVGTIRQRTNALVPGPNLRLAGATEGSFHVELTNPAPGAFKVIRFAYKVRWKVEDQNVEATSTEESASESKYRLREIAKDPLGPQTRWMSSDESCGWIDVASTSILRETLPAWRAGFPVNLLKGTSYEIVAYGFNIGDLEGTELGNVQGKTSGDSRFPGIAEAIAADHTDILLRYGKKISDVHRKPVIDLVKDFDPDIYDAKEILMADHRDDLANGFTTLSYVIGMQPSVFKSWQEEEKEQDLTPGITLEGFVIAEFPEVAASLALEVGPPVFQRGDASPDGMLDITDPVRILSFLFDGQGTDLPCLDAADANDSSGIDVSDPVYMLNFLFGDGPEPPSPYGACGPDTTSDELDCEFYASCPN